MLFMYLTFHGIAHTKILERQYETFYDAVYCLYYAKSCTLLKRVYGTEKLTL